MRLVATDLDGTLVRNDGTVSDYTRAVLTALEAIGVPVLFATARPLRWMDQVWPLVGGHGMAIVSNGAIWYDVEQRQVRQLWGIDADTGLALTEAIRAVIPQVVFALETVTGIRYDPNFVDEWDAPHDAPRGELAAIWTDPVAKLLVMAPGVASERLQSATLSAVGDSAVVTWSVPELMEISAAGITKATTLAMVASELGIASEDVVAFGDGHNDIEMLTWAGSGYAMRNADPSLKAIADHLAPSNEDEGVARTLVDIFELTEAQLATGKSQE